MSLIPDEILKGISQQELYDNSLVPLLEKDIKMWIKSMMASEEEKQENVYCVALNHIFLCLKNGYSKRSLN